MKGIMSI